MGSGGTAEVRSAPPSGNSTWCARGYSTSSWITDTTFGAHCWDPRFSSRYDCAAICSWDPSRLVSPQCVGMPPAPTLPGNASTVTAGAVAACLQHLPCSPGAADSPAAPDGPCYCCDLHLDVAVVSAAAPVPDGQLWTLIVGQVLFCVWLLLLTRTQLRCMQAADERVVTASDYSVRITGLQTDRTDDASLRSWWAAGGQAGCWQPCGLERCLPEHSALLGALLQTTQACPIPSGAPTTEAWSRPSACPRSATCCALGGA